MVVLILLLVSVILLALMTLAIAPTSSAVPDVDADVVRQPWGP